MLVTGSRWLCAGGEGDREGAGGVGEAGRRERRWRREGGEREVRGRGYGVGKRERKDNVLC